MTRWTHAEERRDMLDDRWYNVSHASVYEMAFDVLLAFTISEAPGRDGKRRVTMVLDPSEAKCLLRTLKMAIHRYEHFIGPIQDSVPPRSYAEECALKNSEGESDNPLIPGP